MHATAVEYLLPNLLKENANILDVGCGSGYLAVVMARLTSNAKVYGIDYIPELIELCLHNTKKVVRCFCMILFVLFDF